MRRWLRLVFADDDKKDGTAVAVEGEEALAHDPPDGLIAAEELPSAAGTLEDLFSDQPAPTDEEIPDEAFPMNDWGSDEPEIAAKTQAMPEPMLSPDLPNTSLDSLLSGSPNTEAIWEPEDEQLPYVPEMEAPPISANELASATHTLAEIFPADHMPDDPIPEPEAFNIDRKIPFSFPLTEMLLAEEGREPSEITEYGALGPVSEHASGAKAEAGTRLISPGVKQKTSHDSPLPPRVPTSDWALEEKLASHREWFESQGAAGKKADFSGAKMEGAELIGLNLRLADFHDANLQSADFLLTDLRDACLVRANLDEACLVGANLEGANLEGTNLETTLGLVARQIAGANLRDAHLPPQVIEFPAAADFDRTSKLAARYFIAVIAACAICCLAIWKTNDVQLLTDASIVPFLHSHAAAAALPAKESYLLMPVVLFVLYLVFQFHLQRLWHCVLELPAVFPDGKTLGENQPPIITALLRAHFRWMNDEVSSTHLIEKGVSLFLAYWAIPLTLIFFWVRYLTVQDFHGTFLQLLLAMCSIGVAAHSTTKIGRPQETWALHTNWRHRALTKMRTVSPATVAFAAGCLLLLLSIGTILGVPHDRNQSLHYAASNPRRWAPGLLWLGGIDPYADLTKASLSVAPANWTGADDQFASVDGRRLNGAKFRYAQGHGLFLANAQLWKADFEGAFLSQADFRGADMGQSNMRFSVLDEARMFHTNLDRANLEGAHLSRTDLREANLSYASLVGAEMVDAHLAGASFYTARLNSATMTRADMEKTDLRDSHLEDARLDHANFRGAYLWSANLSRANLSGAQFGSAILIDANLSGADLREAQLSGAVMNGTNIKGANLDGADLRGTPGLTAYQVCSAKSRRGALLDDVFEKLVEAQCGAGQ